MATEPAALDRFRMYSRGWLARVGPIHGWDRPPDPDLDDGTRVERARQCQHLLLDAGLAGITWPREHGGQGLGIQEQVVFDQEAAAYELPLVPLVIGLGMCGPTLIALGTDQQEARYLGPLLRADELWSQLFSEPAAGSDLAGLTTRASARGGDWIIDGQKVWTSGAKHCDFALLLARTNPAVPKHRGLTMFILDLHTPGVEIRPLRQMNGAARFNEVFLDGVRVPKDSVVGTLDQGWQAALTNLSAERISIAAGNARRDSHDVSTLIGIAKGADREAEPVVRQDLAAALARERVASWLVARVSAQVLAGRAPGPEGSLAKLAGTNRSQAAAQLAVNLVGSTAVAWDPRSKHGRRWADVLASAPGLSIAGGTTEIQKNVIGERVLGLAKEPDVSRPNPFPPCSEDQR